MDSLVVRQESQMSATFTELDLGGIEHLASFPNWLRVLVGSYPESWANEATYLVLLSKFSKYSVDAMDMAVDAYTDEETKFPSPAALRPYVERFAPRNYTAEFIESMKRAGYRFVGDVDHTMTFESLATGNMAEVIH